VSRSRNIYYDSTSNPPRLGDLVRRLQIRGLILKRRRPAAAAANGPTAEPAATVGQTLGRCHRRVSKINVSMQSATTFATEMSSNFTFYQTNPFSDRQSFFRAVKQDVFPQSVVQTGAKKSCPLSRQGRRRRWSIQSCMTDLVYT
jgi:hypothetical protein